MKLTICPKCQSEDIVKSGIIKNRQRFKCKVCNYNFTVNKVGKEIDSYYVVKALQLYVEGISMREIERVLGVSHVSVRNWVKKYNIKSPEKLEYHPTYKVLSHKELCDYVAEGRNLSEAGLMISSLGDKYMLIRWERFRD
ncbi:transposase-like zinc-binding domain-containing protein [Marivirga arenosa]|uniref:Helix-turn-helix domain-containing protein n=1 Tax=Marivirga arenosa TaxID=3059076 RepID=A0AA49GDC3_9BACT|nr:helix-turn-helix domain-containing protein [Marivirga sp. BKB1-2]WKK81798.2 helix-turn-helix domain-containing protein [Marivirga sp. BKB1-2]